MKGGSAPYNNSPEETPEDACARVSNFLAEKYPEEAPVEALASLSEKERREWLGSFSEQELRVLEYSYEFLARPNQREPKGKYKILILLAGRGYGKEVRSSTPIATPTGFTEIGNLRIGDYVFDENGIPTRVTGVYPQGTKQLYRFRFSDETIIDAGAEHMWVTWTHRDRKALLRSRHVMYKDRFPDDWVNWRAVHEHYSGNILSREDAPGPRIRTTTEIINTFTCSKRRDLNHCIPVAGSLYTQPIEFPLDFYCFGYWLGDGHSADGVITVGDEDIEWTLGKFSSMFEFKLDAPVGRCWMIRCYGLAARLRSLGVFGSGMKSVPEECFLASRAQRIALLQGLMDSDGYASDNGSSVEFCNTNKNIADGVLRLARSLGQKPILNTGRATLYGKDCGEKYRVTWKPTIDVFQMPRKRDRIRFDRSQALRNQHRMIENITSIDSDDATCISVDSPNSMYLVGEGLIPTHNTWTGAQLVRSWVESGKKKHIAIVGTTAADVRDTMVEAVYKNGSGLMQVCPPWNLPYYSPTKKTLVWNNPNYPSYGAVGSLYSADVPASLRGPSHDAAWVDELCKMRNHIEMWNMLKFTMRRETSTGEGPKIVISTTPKLMQLLVDLLKEAEESRADGTNDVIVVKGSTYENQSNLSADFLSDIASYEGTDLGRQEIHADLILNATGALWTPGILDKGRIQFSDLPTLKRIVVAVDPQTGYREDSESPVHRLSRVARSTMTGIITCGLGMPVKGQPLHAYILRDDSVNGKPEKWGKRVVDVYNLYAQRYPTTVLAESNQGGLMIGSIIRSIDPHVRVQLVSAQRKKHERAIEVVNKYQQVRVHHVGHFPALEQEQTFYEPGDEDSKLSPNRMDALVHGVRYLLVDGIRSGAGIAISRRV